MQLDTGTSTEVHNFTKEIPIWRKNIDNIVSKFPYVVVLQVGMGESSRWIMDSYLKNSADKMAIVDSFKSPGGESNDRLDKFWNSIREYHNKVLIMDGHPNIALREKQLLSIPFNLIHLNINAPSGTMFTQLVLSWGLLQSGGLMVVSDQYTRWSRELSIVMSVFTTAMVNELDVLVSDNVTILAKR